MAKAYMLHPEGIGASWRGEVYKPVDGLIEVPVEAAHELRSHGFEIEGVYEDKPARGRRKGAVEHVSEPDAEPEAEVATGEAAA